MDTLKKNVNWELVLRVDGQNTLNAFWPMCLWTIILTIIWFQLWRNNVTDSHAIILLIGDLEKSLIYLINKVGFELIYASNKYSLKLYCDANVARARDVDLPSHIHV